MNDEDNDFGYVSPADFVGPASITDDVNSDDENNLSTLEAVSAYLRREVQKCRLITSLEEDDDTKGLSLEQRWAVQLKLSRKLELALAGVEDTINGIKEKYDETRR